MQKDTVLKMCETSFGIRTGISSWILIEHMQKDTVLKMCTPSRPQAHFEVIGAPGEGWIFTKHIKLMYLKKVHAVEAHSPDGRVG